VRLRVIVLIGLATFFLILAGICAVLAISTLLPGLRKEARVAATATRTPQPTYTATPPQTATPVSSATPVPSLTPTASSTLPPTNTPLPSPIPTETLPPTPVATDTQAPPPSPMATATATVKPTQRPTRRPTNTPVPQPTNTPPPPFTGSVVIGFANCSLKEVMGFVTHASGDPYAGVAIGVWTDQWKGRVVQSEASGKYSLNLGDPGAGSYKVAVVRLESCPWQGELQTAVDCAKLSNLVPFDITAHCDGPGASNVTQVDFTGQ
jgi:hypothetical protein